MRLPSVGYTVLVLVPCLMVAIGLPDKAGAQEVQPPATGLGLWLRTPVSAVRSATATASGVPEFTVGYRGDGFGIGAGFGLLMLEASDDYNKLTGTIWQVEASGWFDVWRSPDGRTRGNVFLSLGAGNAELKDVYDEEMEEENTDKLSGTLMSLRLGFGGDQFLSPHFALGAEGGFQGIFGKDLKEEGEPEKVSLSANGFYGALRTMFVF